MKTLAVLMLVLPLWLSAASLREELDAQRAATSYHYLDAGKSDVEHWTPPGLRTRLVLCPGDVVKLADYLADYGLQDFPRVSDLSPIGLSIKKVNSLPIKKRLGRLMELYREAFTN